MIGKIKTALSSNSKKAQSSPGFSTNLIPQSEQISFISNLFFLKVFLPQLGQQPRIARLIHVDNFK